MYALTLSLHVLWNRRPGNGGGDQTMYVHVYTNYLFQLFSLPVAAGVRYTAPEGLVYESIRSCKLQGEHKVYTSLQPKVYMHCKLLLTSC